MGDEIISFRDLVEEEVIDKHLNGGKASADELNFIAPEMPGDEARMKMYMSLMIAAIGKSKNNDLDEFTRILIEQCHLPVSEDEVSHYMNTMAVCEHEDGWSLLFFTSCAVWQKLMEDLQLNPDFEFLMSDKNVNEAIKTSGRTELTHDYYANLLTVIVSHAFMINQKEFTELLPELADPAMSRLEDDEREYMTSFVLITLALATLELSKIRTIDNKRVNDWIESSGLTQHSSRRDIISTASRYFKNTED